MFWIHALKGRHEQQQEDNYLKNKPFSKSFNYFWNVNKDLFEKKNNNNNIQSSLPEMFLKDTVSEYLF